MLWLRRETKSCENRTALVPSDMKQLIQQDIEIIVETSQARCFDDQLYAEVGAKLTGESFQEAPQGAYILGIKELPNESSYRHKHIYFSHLLKDQSDPNNILEKFKQGAGCILDLELLENNKRERLVTFSNCAGTSAAALSLILWDRIMNRKNIRDPIIDLKRSQNLDRLINRIISSNFQVPKFLVVGSLGNAGNSTMKYLRNLSQSVTGLTQDDTNEIKDITKLANNYDVIINCISTKDKPFTIFNLNALPNGELKTKLIIDLTCEPGNQHNPIPMYKKCNSLINPVTVVGYEKQKLYISAIDNVASIISQTASEVFSKQLTPYLIELFDKDINESVWSKPYKRYNTTQGILE